MIMCIKMMPILLLIAGISAFGFDISPAYKVFGLLSIIMTIILTTYLVLMFFNWITTIDQARRLQGLRKFDD